MPWLRPEILGTDISGEGNGRAEGLFSLQFSRHTDGGCECQVGHFSPRSGLGTKPPAFIILFYSNICVNVEICGALATAAGRHARHKPMELEALLGRQSSTLREPRISNYQHG